MIVNMEYYSLIYHTTPHCLSGGLLGVLQRFCNMLKIHNVKSTSDNFLLCKLDSASPETLAISGSYMLEDGEMTTSKGLSLIELG
jgi:hypothetical protein